LHFGKKITKYQKEVATFQLGFEFGAFFKSKYTRSIFYLGQIALKQANYIIKSKEWGVLLPKITFSQKEVFELIF